MASLYKHKGDILGGVSLIQMCESKIKLYHFSRFIALHAHIKLASSGVAQISNYVIIYDH